MEFHRVKSRDMQTTSHSSVPSDCQIKIMADRKTKPFKTISAELSKHSAKFELQKR